MEDETKKTEENPTGNKKTEKETEQPNIIESFLNSPIGKLLNTPIAANAALGAFLYWAIDPKGLKATMEAVDKKMDYLIEVVGEQAKEIQILKRQLTRKKRLREDENNEKDEDLKGTRKETKRIRTIFLD